jgi:hypothetical protein
MGNLAGYIATIVVSVIAGAILYRLKQRLDPTAKLYWAHTHAFAFGPSPQILITTRSVLIENNGRAAAEGVEVIHTGRPQHFQIYPPRQHTETTLPDGHHVIVLGKLAPKERVTLELLAVAPPGQAVGLPVTVMVRGDGILSMHVPVGPQRVFPRWLQRILLTVFFVGVITIVTGIVWLALLIAERVGL